MRPDACSLEVEMTDLPYLRTIKIGHFKEPASLDGLPHSAAGFLFMHDACAAHASLHSPRMPCC